MSYLMSNSSDSGNGRNCSTPRLLRSRDLERPRAVRFGGFTGSIASEERSCCFLCDGNNANND